MRNTKNRRRAGFLYISKYISVLNASGCLGGETDVRKRIPFFTDNGFWGIPLNKDSDMPVISDIVIQRYNLNLHLQERTFAGTFPGSFKFKFVHISPHFVAL